MIKLKPVTRRHLGMAWAIIVHAAAVLVAFAGSAEMRLALVYAVGGTAAVHLALNVITTVQYIRARRGLLRSPLAYLVKARDELG